MNELLQRRAREVRRRRLILAWEYRQRNLSKGVWFRLRRVLADASSAWAVSDEDVDALRMLACPELPIGSELEPPKRIFWASSSILKTLASRREMRVQLSAELLAAPNLVLVRHGE